MKTSVKITVLFFAFFILQTSGTFAGEIHFANGDRLTGHILELGSQAIRIDVDGMGIVSVDRKVVSKALTDEDLAQKVLEDAKKKKNWGGELKGGFDRKRGNTNTTELYTEGNFHISGERLEFKSEGRAYYASEDRKMNAQKYRGMVRLDYKLGEEKRWYGYGRLEGDHDRFANIDSRFTPGAGLGYWLLQKERYKAKVESAIGYEYTRYRDGSNSTGELVLIPSAYVEVGLIGKSKLTEEVTVYPSLTSGEYRLISETVFDNPVTEEVSLQFKLIDEYNSDPGDDAKTNDVRIISLLAYTF